MMILRFLSGAAEATADPAFVTITGMWYTRPQQPIRIGLWYSANGVGIALGGLLGYAIGHVRGFLYISVLYWSCGADQRFITFVAIRVPDHRCRVLVLGYRSVHLRSELSVLQLAVVQPRG